MPEVCFENSMFFFISQGIRGAKVLSCGLHSFYMMLTSTVFAGDKSFIIGPYLYTYFFNYKYMYTFLNFIKETGYYFL